MALFCRAQQLLQDGQIGRVSHFGRLEEVIISRNVKSTNLGCGLSNESHVCGGEQWRYVQYACFPNYEVDSVWWF